MNLSRLMNSYNFKEYDSDMFKVLSSDQTLPIKVSESLKHSGDNSKVRIINNWMLSVSQNSMFVWKYSSYQKNIISSYKEFFLPNSELKYSSNQGMIINDKTDNKPVSCIIVGDDGLVRFWPEISSTNQYIDQKISNIYNDSCLMVEKLYDDVLVFIFRSMKLIIADLKDYTDVGISFKQFTQPIGFINGIGRCISSIFVTSSSQNFPFINIKSNKHLKEDSEILLLVNNNIDSLCLDVLQNGKYTKEILNQSNIKKAISKVIDTKSYTESEYLDITLRNFDICRNIFYIFLEVIQHTNKKSNWLVTYNRNIDVIDSVARIISSFDGEVEIMAMDDELQNTDQPCLLAAVRDNHRILLIEVLTGTIKSQLDASDCLKSNSVVNSKQSIIGWACPKLAHDSNTIVVALTASKQIVFIKQKINPFVNETINRLQAETDLSNISFSEINTRNISHRGDIENSNISLASKIHPMALSTPKSKLDQRGDRFADDSIQSMNRGNWNQQILDTSFQSTIDHLNYDDSVYGEFKKCVMLFWLGYKTQANRLMTSIIESSLLDPEVSIPLFTLQIAREIIDEKPIKDPRWLKIKNQTNVNKFSFSNKSLILSQQLSSKREALQNLLLMLKENNFDLFGTMGNLAPMSVYKSLMMPGMKSDLQLFGDCKVSWSMVNCIGMAGEFLEFTRIFNEIMLNNQCQDIDTILMKSCNHILSVQKKLNPIEIISQEISLVPTFINDCCEYLNEKRDGLTNIQDNISDHIIDVKRICQLLARIISSCLRASLSYRKKFETSFLPGNFNCSYVLPSTSAACWISEAKPIGVSESIIDLIINLVDFARNLESSQIFEYVYEIVAVYLDCYKHRIEWMETFSNNQTDLERIINSFKEMRYQLIDKLVEDGKFMEKGLELADRFQDFHWITALCEVLDDQCGETKKLHLEFYLVKYCDEGLSEYVLDWYQDKLKDVTTINQGKLLAKIQLILEKIQKLEGTNMSTKMENSNSSMIIGRFLERAEVQSTRWLHEIEVNDFNQAARTLMKLGELECQLLGRKKNLLSLAKLSCLAIESEDSSQSDINKMLETNRCYLQLIKFQEDIAPNVISNQLGFTDNKHNQPPIEISKLVKLYLSSAINCHDDDITYIKPIVKALQLLQFAKSNNHITKLSQQQFDDLLSTIWSQTILLDNWTNPSSISIDTTAISLVMKQAVTQSIELDHLLPNMDTLFTNDMLQQLINDHNVVYAIKRAFETMIIELNYCPMIIDNDCYQQPIDMEIIN